LERVRGTLRIAAPHRRRKETFPQQIFVALRGVAVGPRSGLPQCYEH
jgi:hypothetical protein